jgi:glycosyltransferase involved in cell wall biosynthesis
VVWWTSAFDHVRKRHRCDGDRCISFSQCYRLWLLHARGYSSNISLARVANHRQIAKSFRRLAPDEPRPDVIVCSWPTVELCAEAVRLGKMWGIPVVLDVRDLWPNAIADLAPQVVRPAARFALRGAFQRARFAASHATAITGITSEYVDWGVACAERPRTNLDRHFPLGYVDRRPNDANLRDAEQYWARQGVALDRGHFIACWFGMFGRNSEIGTVVKAARQLVDLGKSIRFVLCGTGPELERYRRLAHDCPNVLLPGWVNAAQIWTLLRASSVGLAPYVNSENYVRNLPNKPVEYLSAGLPIVSSLQGVLAKLLAENYCGVTYRNGSPDELTRALADLLDSPRLQQMSEHASALYRSQFVAEHVYSNMHTYLKDVVKSFAPAREIVFAA